MKITPNPNRAFHTPTLTSWARGVQARAHSTFRKHIYVSPFCLAVLGSSLALDMLGKCFTPTTEYPVPASTFHPLISLHIILKY